MSADMPTILVAVRNTLALNGALKRHQRRSDCDAARPTELADQQGNADERWRYVHHDGDEERLQARDPRETRQLRQ